VRTKFGVAVDSLYFLIPIAILFVGIALKLFFWAVNSGQYDDLETESRRILFDEDQPLAPSQKEKSSGEEKN
jgi:cbb3-type cytochrome oxidase maturation protein